jgi:hypothetical protein
MLPTGRTGNFPKSHLSIQKRWAINTFKPFKMAGTDEMVPALLQQGVKYLKDSFMLHLYSLPGKRIYTHSLEAGQSDVYTQTNEGQLY